MDCAPMAGLTLADVVPPKPEEEEEGAPVAEPGPEAAVGKEEGAKPASPAAKEAAASPAKEVEP